MTRRAVLDGKRFGILTVLSLSPHRPHRQSHWICRCDCGKVKTVAYPNLKSGNTVSCGCLVKTRSEKNKKDVGRRRARVAWAGMRQRCDYRTYHSWGRYGGRGITICERWRDFENFLADMGRPDAGMTLDRIDGNGNYEPSNCRWATRREQQGNIASNRWLECWGQRMILADWSRKTGISESVISNRIRLGWSVERALTKNTTRVDKS